MGFFDSVFSGYKSVKGRSNYPYDVLENTPYLHSSQQLRELTKGASKDQKASVYRHMVDVDVHDNPELKGYYDLSREIWDDFREG